jgi:ABC-2 type transport system permease protein
MIDGFRYGFLGTLGLSAAREPGGGRGEFFVVSLLTLKLLQSGYKLRH